MVALVLSSVIEARLFDFKRKLSQIIFLLLLIVHVLLRMLLNLNCIDSFTLNMSSHVNQFLLIDDPQLH